MDGIRYCRYAKLFLLCFIALNSIVPATAQIATGGSYALEQGVIANGGGSSSGAGYAVDGTSGQSAAGDGFLGGSYGLGDGFWTFLLSQAAPGMISGTVRYGNAAAPPKYISNVLVTGTGSPNVSTTTAAPGGTAGQYTLTGFGSGSYTVSLSKTTGQNGITSNDAARIAQHVSGSVPLTNNNQRVTADVSNNGVISSFDAAQIANFVATGSSPGLAGQWRFFVSPGPTFPVGASPTSRTYASVTNSVAGEDFIGLLMGDVTGNWTPTAARQAEGSK